MVASVANLRRRRMPRSGGAIDLSACNVSERPNNRKANRVTDDMKKTAVSIFKTSEDLINEQKRIVAFWLAGNRSFQLAERFVECIETLELRGIVDYELDADETIISILELYYEHRP